MKKKIITICAAVLFLTALGLTLYPLVSNYVNQKYASEIQTAYLIVNSHPGLTDLFVSAFRKELCRQQEKTVKPSVLDKLQRQPIKNSPKISANFHGQER